jgi:hypothetical protein
MALVHSKRGRYRRALTSQEKTLLLAYCDRRMHGEAGLNARTAAMLGAFNVGQMSTARRMTYDYFSRYKILFELARSFGAKDPEVRKLISRALHLKRITAAEFRELRALKSQATV